jgi:hypothetical protein
MRIIFSADQAAAALWTYAEDALVKRAEGLADSDLRHVWGIAGRYWRDDLGLPIEGKLVLDKVTALACVTFLEGQVPPSARADDAHETPCRNDSATLSLCRLTLTCASTDVPFGSQRQRKNRPWTVDASGTIGPWKRGSTSSRSARSAVVEAG